MLAISMGLHCIWGDFGEETHVDRAYLLCCLLLTFDFASVDSRCKIYIGRKALRWSLFLRVIVLCTKFGIFLFIFYFQKLKTTPPVHIPKL